jgi:hypothetical protein
MIRMNMIKAILSAISVEVMTAEMEVTTPMIKALMNPPKKFPIPPRMTIINAIKVKADPKWGWTVYIGMKKEATMPESIPPVACVMR